MISNPLVTLPISSVGNKNCVLIIKFFISDECCNKLEHLEMTWCFKYREVNVNKISARIAQNLKSLFLVRKFLNI